jgi:hypothetical protein
MKKRKSIFSSVRKELAPPTRVFKTRKDQPDRKAKHKGNLEVCEYCPGCGLPGGRQCKNPSTSCGY